MSKQRGGHNKKPESWWINNRGYVEGRIWLPDGTQIRVKKHRLVMERILGRPLFPSEDVHHIDGNKLNNEPSNLSLIAHGEHTRKNNNSREYKKGYNLKLTDEQRRVISERASRIRLWNYGIPKRWEGKNNE